ncbi:MAG: response regulator transcription factor [Chloroflexota bacterium]
MIRVLLAAPSPALRAGLRSLLAADSQVEVVGESARLTDLDDPEADILILSASASSLTTEWLPPDSISLLLLTDSPLTPSDALRSRPAFGLLPSDASPEELLAAVRALAEGLTVGPRSLLFPSDPSDSAERGPLTERELEVLSLLAKGLANKQIAAALGISEHTVKFHVSSIYSKLNATNRAEAIRAGLRGGWIAL